MKREQTQSTKLFNNLLKDFIGRWIERMEDHPFTSLYPELADLKHKVALAPVINDWDNNVKALKAFYKSPKHRRLVRVFRQNEDMLNDLIRVQAVLRKGQTKYTIDPDYLPGILLVLKFCDELIAIIQGKKRVSIPRRPFLSMSFKDNLIMQKKLFREGKYKTWKRYYKQELITTRKLVKMLERMDIEMNPSISRTSQSIKFWSDLSNLLVVATAMCFLAAVVTESHMSSLDKDMTFEFRLKQHAFHLRDKMVETDAEIAFQEKWGIDIYGAFKGYTDELDSFLTELTQRIPNAIKRAKIKRLYISPIMQDEAAGLVRPHDVVYGTHMVLFVGHITKVTFDHEWAHMLFLAIAEYDSNLTSDWKKINSNFMPTSTTSQYADQSKTSGNLPRYGFVNSYGSKNYHENWATHIEYIRNHPKVYLQVIADFQIYANTFHFILSKGAISRAEYDYVLRMLKIAHQRANR